MLEYLRLVFAAEFGRFHLVRLFVTSDSERQVKVGVKIVRHGVAVIEIVRHDEIADIHHYILCPVRQGFV